MASYAIFTRNLHDALSKSASPWPKQVETICWPHFILFFYYLFVTSPQNIDKSSAEACLILVCAFLSVSSKRMVTGPPPDQTWTELEKSPGQFYYCGLTFTTSTQSKGKWLIGSLVVFVALSDKVCVRFSYISQMIDWESRRDFPLFLDDHFFVEG